MAKSDLTTLFLYDVFQRKARVHRDLSCVQYLSAPDNKLKKYGNEGENAFVAL